jgi:hypothetical protein
MRLSINSTQRGFNMHSDVYTQAAERISSERNGLSCIAINRAADVAYSPFNFYVLAYEELFGPHTSEERKAHPWWNKHTLESKSLRVLALCFMAAIVEAGDA